MFFSRLRASQIAISDSAAFGLASDLLPHRPGAVDGMDLTRWVLIDLLAAGPCSDGQRADGRVRRASGWEHHHSTAATNSWGTPRELQLQATSLHQRSYCGICVYATMRR